MTEITLRSDMEVKLIDHMASDIAVVRAAQVSIKGENNPETDMPRLINYLLSSRHGSPFEHAVFTFFVKAPLFVFREWHRHRIASYNEMSGRYTQLLPEFYTPGPDRPLLNTGTSARPEFTAAPPELTQRKNRLDKTVANIAWSAYERQLELGIANELARTVLPVSVYSQMYWTVNARSLMNFLSLRIDHPDALVRSRPQWEIQMPARLLEEHFKELMPHTYESFVNNGRVAP